MDFFQKGGGASDFFVERGGGLTKSKSFGTLFAQILGEL